MKSGANARRQAGILEAALERNAALVRETAGMLGAAAERGAAGRTAGCAGKV
jgi:hypothetical protein